jgi:hypothetical protein
VRSFVFCLDPDGAIINADNFSCKIFAFLRQKCGVNFVSLFFSRKLTGSKQSFSTKEKLVRGLGRRPFVQSQGRKPLRPHHSLITAKSKPQILGYLFSSRRKFPTKICQSLKEPCLGVFPPFPPDNFFLLRFAPKKKLIFTVTLKNVHPFGSASLLLISPDARRLAAGYKQQRLALLFINWNGNTFPDTKFELIL